MWKVNFQASSALFIHTPTEVAIHSHVLFIPTPTEDIAMLQSTLSENPRSLVLICSVTLLLHASASTHGSCYSFTRAIHSHTEVAIHSHVLFIRTPTEVAIHSHQ